MFGMQQQFGPSISRDGWIPWAKFQVQEEKARKANLWHLKNLGIFLTFAGAFNSVLHPDSLATLLGL